MTMRMKPGNDVNMSFPSGVCVCVCVCRQVVAEKRRCMLSWARESVAR